MNKVVAKKSRGLGHALLSKLRHAGVAAATPLFHDASQRASCDLLPHDQPVRSAADLPGRLDCAGRPVAAPQPSAAHRGRSGCERPRRVSRGSRVAHGRLMEPAGQGLGKQRRRCRRRLGSTSRLPPRPSPGSPTSARCGPATAQITFVVRPAACVLQAIRSSQGCREATPPATCHLPGRWYVPCRSDTPVAAAGHHSSLLCEPAGRSASAGAVVWPVAVGRPGSGHI